MNQKIVERNSLIVSTIVNIIMTGAGLWVFFATGIQALFLDFFFSLIATLSTIIAIIISKSSYKKTIHYPDGLYFIEPVYAIFKASLTLILLIISVYSTGVSAYNYFIYNIGKPLNIRPTLPYAAVMVVLCLGLGMFNQYQNNKINGISTILSAESKSNFIDGLISLGIGLAIIPLYFIPLNSSLGFLHYTFDFFITAILVLVSVKQPISILISSFRELSGGTISDTVIKKNIIKIVHNNLAEVMQEATCDIFKIGMYIKVRINLGSGVNDITNFYKTKEKILIELQSIYENIDVIFLI